MPVTDYVSVFDRSIRALFTDALGLSLRDPALALFMARMLASQHRAARVRRGWEQRGVHVPPLVIVSVTKRCNLHCAGCYFRAQEREGETEMSAEKLRSVINEAHELGASLILIAGGEPLTRPEILDITADFPHIVFPLFTNGLLLDEATVARLRRQPHVVPVLSLEGHAQDTDARRGRGVHHHLQSVMQRLRHAHVFYGISFTVTRANYDLVTDPAYVGELRAAGGKLFFYVDYVPVQPGTEALALSEEQHLAEAQRLLALRAQQPALYVALPGDEELYGGCLAAGRGFVHISPEGRVEPCPFAPYSDASLANLSLKEALNSELLRTIRESDVHLAETNGGCALWQHRDWVAGLLQER